MRKCAHIKGCQNEAVWAMQYIGEDMPTFYALGWHVRGFAVTPVCDQHKKEIKSATCKHVRRIGDNYGESCQDCGKQLSGYGYGGWFGANLNEHRECIHLFSPIGGDQDSAKICIYCEQIKETD